MPNRIIRESILSSEKIASLGWPEEVFYRRLQSVVDDYGRYEANPLLLRSKCYPLQIDTVRTADITRWMAACQKAGVILGYEVDGKQYLEVVRFEQQQRSASKFPPPPADASKCYQMPANAHLGVVVSVVEDVFAEDGAAPPTPAILLPLNTGPEHPVFDDQIAEYKILYPAVDVIGELRKMRGWLQANPANRKTKKGIAAFVARWLAKEQDKGRTVAAAPQVNTSMGASPVVVKTAAQEEADRITGLKHMANLGNEDAKAELRQLFGVYA